MIRVEHLYKNYGDSIEVLFGVNSTLEDGGTYAIIGNGGEEKSTFIRYLNMLEVPTSEDIFYSRTKINDPETDLARVREKIGMIFQSFNLFDHMRAIGDVTYALRKVKETNVEGARAEGLFLLEKVGLRHRADACPHQLSDGKKQRCMIARALAVESDVLLFDKPTSALDSEMAGEILEVLQDLNHTGVTIIVVTHEMNFAKKVADYVTYMDKGNIEECSKATEFFEGPKTARAREFLSKMI